MYAVCGTAIAQNTVTIVGFIILGLNFRILYFCRITYKSKEQEFQFGSHHRPFSGATSGVLNYSDGMFACIPEEKGKPK